MTSLSRRTTLLHSAVVILVLATSAVLPSLHAGDTLEGNGAVMTTSDGCYSLFNPVPKDKLREFDSDRPDQADDAYTVDAGHLYVEVDFANYTYDRHNAERTPTEVDGWNVAPINLRLGLLPQVELDLQFDGYSNVRTRDRAAGLTQTQSGVGDFAAGLKINLFGNDDGKVAFAVLPLLRLPTSTAGLASGSVEGGLGLALSVKLPGEFDLTVFADFESVRNSTDAYYVGQYSQAIGVSHELGLEHLSGFVEFASEVTSESPSPAACQVDTGLLYRVSENVQLDVDCYFGVTRDAPDYVPFAGLAVRF